MMHRASVELKASGIEARALKIRDHAIEPEALRELDSEVRELGAQIVVLTLEVERYTRALHKKLSLPFDILTDLHLKLAEQFGLVFTFPDYLRDLYKSFGSTLDRFHDESEYRLPMPARYRQGQPAQADPFRFRAAGSPSLGTRNLAACSSWRKPAMFQCGGRAGPACVTGA